MYRIIYTVYHENLPGPILLPEQTNLSCSSQKPQMIFITPIYPTKNRVLPGPTAYRVVLETHSIRIPYIYDGMLVIVIFAYMYIYMPIYLGDSLQTKLMPHLHRCAHLPRLFIVIAKVHLLLVLVEEKEGETQGEHQDHAVDYPAGLVSCLPSTPSPAPTPHLREMGY